MIHFIPQHGDTLFGIALFVGLLNVLNFFFGNVDAQSEYYENQAEEDWNDDPSNPLSQNFRRD
jgi:hypothetical protein